MSEKTLGRGGPIRPLDEVVMNGGQGRQFALAEAVPTMVPESKLAVPSFDARGRTLKKLGALDSYFFNFI